MCLGCHGATNFVSVLQNIQIKCDCFTFVELDWIIFDRIIVYQDYDTCDAVKLIVLVVYDHDCALTI